MQPPKTKRERALYRCSLSCKIGKDACEDKGIPAGANKQDWLFYQLFSAIEEIAMAMEVDSENTSEKE